MSIVNRCLVLVVFLFSFQSYASPDNTQLAVWANEAIIATYSYDYKNFLERQREIAKYFTADGWTEYASALKTSDLPNEIQKNAYVVTAVATLPPKITLLEANKWQAIMPILVIYKNPQYQQKQTLTVKMTMALAPEGQGVRGLAITNLQSKVSQAACPCTAELEDATDDTQPPPTAPQSGKTKEK